MTKPILSAVVVLALLVPPAHAGEWHVDTSHEGNQVQFTSEVVSLRFDGVSQQIDGFIYWEGDALFAQNGQFRFEVDMASFDTGIGKRDRDLRAVLNTKKWPKASFTGTLSPPAPDTSAAHSYVALARGTFSLHGVERPVEVPAHVVLDGAHAEIDARFALRLLDYQIEAPSLAAFIKVSEEVDVLVHVRMNDIAQEKE